MSLRGKVPEGVASTGIGARREAAFFIANVSDVYSLFRDNDRLLPNSSQYRFIRRSREVANGPAIVTSFQLLKLEQVECPETAGSGSLAQQYQRPLLRKPPLKMR